MTIIDYTEHVDLRMYRALENPDTIAVHRFGRDLEYGIDFGSTPSRWLSAFTEGDAGKWTGRKFPYHIVVGGDGRLWQFLPLSVQGVHARSWNTHSVGVACYGDFRTEDAGIVQFHGLKAALKLLLKGLALPVTSIRPHDGLPGGSSDASKICPGDGIHLQEIVHELAEGLIVRG